MRDGEFEAGEGVSHKESNPIPPTADLLIATAQVASERSGLETFARYLWQAKQAVRQWLTCLSGAGPVFVVCEQVEDITLVYEDRIRFLQLKTRDRGSWSAPG